MKGTDAYLNTYRDEWREVFVISAEIYAFGILIYLILASGEEQYWANGWPPKATSGSDTKPSGEPAVVVVPVEKSVIVKANIQVETPPIEQTKLLHPGGVDYGSV